MSDTDTVKESVAESARRLAQHDYVDAQGAVVPIEQAVGNRYKSKSGFTRTWLDGNIRPGTLGSMFAVFGMRTLMTNTTSGARQREESEEKALDDRWGRINAGDWRERGEGAGVRGPKFDKGILAEAIVAVLGDKAAGDVAYYRARLGTDGDSEEAAKAARSYAAKARGKTAVMAKYYELAGSAATESDADSLA